MSIDISALFAPQSYREQSLLANIDVLVEVGIPRDVAERASRWAFEALDRVLDEISELSNTIPNIYERTVMQAVFMGGLDNWLSDKLLATHLAFQAAIVEYNRGNSDD